MVIGTIRYCQIKSMLFLYSSLDYRRRLIEYHIWELKGIDMRYYFTSYNCSTVIYYILSLANPKIYDDKKLWITPLDTVKFLYKYDLIQQSELLPSNEWLIKMLEENIPQTSVKNIKNIVKFKNYNKIKGLNFYSSKLLDSYSKFKYNKNTLDKKELLDINSKINHNLFKDNVFDISKYKSPSKIPSERQVGIGYSYTNDIDYTKVSFLGASHFINDNNREYFGESELKIGYISFLLNKTTIDLDEFTLYGMKSYIPYDGLTKEYSYQFELAVKKEYAMSFDYLDTFKLDTGIGIDFLIAKDINVFAILNGGLWFNKEDKTKLVINPEVGAMIYELLDMKSYISCKPLFLNDKKIYTKYSLKHSVFINKSWTLSLDIDSIEGKKDITNYTFLLKKLF